LGRHPAAICALAFVGEQERADALSRLPLADRIDPGRLPAGIRRGRALNLALPAVVCREPAGLGLLL
jgi:hypothetical protein